MPPFSKNVFLFCLNFCLNSSKVLFKNLKYVYINNVCIFWKEGKENILFMIYIYIKGKCVIEYSLLVLNH